jgi:hypothetical protein
MKLQDLIRQTKNAKIADIGDIVEQGASVVITRDFPEYENFWRIFILPYRLKDNIRINPDLPKSHEAACIYNYSVMRTIVRLFEFKKLAELKKEINGDTTSQLFEDFFVRIATAYEQTRQFICCTHCAFEIGQGRNDVSIMDWTQKRIREPAFEWLETNSKNNLPKRLQDAEDEVDRYRNHIVHGPKWPGLGDKVPLPQYVKKMIYWSEWASAIESNRKEWEERTTDRLTVINQAWGKLLQLLNETWSSIIKALLRDHGSEAPRNIDKIFFYNPSNPPNPSNPNLWSYPDTVSSSSDFRNITVVQSDGTSLQ